jgi:hypothetical protein
MKKISHWILPALCLLLQACASPKPERTPDAALALAPDSVSRKLNAEADNQTQLTTLNPTRETLWQIYDRLPVLKITPDNLIELESILQASGTNGIVEVDGISSHQLGEPERNLINDWVYQGGTFWIRGNCSIEQSFGLDWKLLNKRGNGDNILIRAVETPEAEQQIVIHPLTIGVYRIRMIKNGYFVPRSDYTKKYIQIILQDEDGILFAELPLGKGAVVFDASMGDRRLKAPFKGIYGFDSGTFWLNFFRHYGHLDERINAFNPITDTP